MLNQSLAPLMSEEEIQARKNDFKSRRLTLNLPHSHFINVFIDWCSGLTDGYIDYMIAAALWLISSFCNNRVEVRLKQEIVRPNLFFTIFGKSTTSRKSTVVNKTRDVYKQVTGELLPNEDFSIEGYLESLSKNPRQHHVRDEVAGFLAKSHKQYNEGFNELECALYDGQDFKKTLASKGNKDPKVFDIKNPYVTKLYATTPDNYLKYMTMEDFLCGRELRTIFVFPSYNKPKMPLALESSEDKAKWWEVCYRAGKICDFVQEGALFNFDPQALEYYSKVTSGLEDWADQIENDLLSSAVGRSQIHMLKLAMLIELGKDPISTTITKESIDIASNAIQSYFLPTLMDLIDRLQEDIKNNMVEKVISVLRRLGGAAQHTKLLHDTKLKSTEFTEIIYTLLESETIERVTEKKTGKLYYILKERKANLNLDIFENPSNHKNLQNLQLSQSKENNNINIINNKYNKNTDYSVRESVISEISEISESQEES